MRIVGIDPSLTSTGIVSVEGGVVTTTERVRSKLKGEERLYDILTSVERTIWPFGREHLPHESGCDDEGVPEGLVVGIEGPAMTVKGAGVVQMFGLYGVLRYQLWQWGVPFYVVGPTVLKTMATGKGNASKDEVLAAVVRRYLDADVTGNDVADALVIAEIGAHHYGEPIAKLPATHTRTLEKMEWPA